MVARLHLSSPELIHVITQSLLFDQHIPIPPISSPNMVTPLYFLFLKSFFCTLHISEIMQCLSFFALFQYNVGWVDPCCHKCQDRRFPPFLRLNSLRNTSISQIRDIHLSKSLYSPVNGSYGSFPCVGF